MKFCNNTSFTLPKQKSPSYSLRNVFNHRERHRIKIKIFAQMIPKVVDKEYIYVITGSLCTSLFTVGSYFLSLHTSRCYYIVSGVQSVAFNCSGFGIHEALNYA